MSTDRIADLEQEILLLKLEITVLIQVLSQTKELPILGPERIEAYNEALNQEMAKAGLKIRLR
jgi:hypothetical protein